MTELLDDLLDAWSVHNEIHLFILDWLPEEGLEAVTLLKTGKPSRGRNVGRTFAHMHAVRCTMLEPNGATDGLPRFESSETPTADRLRDALARSGDAVAALVREAAGEGRRLKRWKRGPAALVTYLVAHEAHHRGQIAQALKQSGVRPPQEVSYGTWTCWHGTPLKKPA